MLPPDDATETMPDSTGPGEPDDGAPAERSRAAAGPDGPLAGTIGATSTPGGEVGTVATGPGPTSSADRLADTAPVSADGRGRAPADIAHGFGTVAGQTRFLGDYEI